MSDQRQHWSRFRTRQRHRLRPCRRRTLRSQKNAGRSQFRAYTERAGERANGLLRRRQDLADAIKEGKIECWYQPQFDAATHQLIGAEALARLRLSHEKLWSPEDFLPLAEQTGLLMEIDEFMFQQVLADQNKWAEAGLYYPRVSVNFSQQRLAEKSLMERITEQIKPHHALSIEVLETAFMDNPDAPMLQRLEGFRALGFGIELDDFGSGHASIVSMLSIKPDKIKIDQRLTKDIATSHSAMTTLKALVTIGRAHNTGIVLEGIETSEQLLACESVDCDVLQGFALSGCWRGQTQSANVFARNRI
ncbi:MAG: EAL domain-containing protein [Paracoccaceae bacterium]